jgi:archaellum component FlaF (FlaF/FlaG flagellin family)
VAYWEKILYDRNEYIVNFDRVTAFCSEPNSRVTFWLPDNAIPIVINQQSNQKDYQKIQEYTNKVTELRENAYWVKIFYEKNEYIINLTCISSFCREPNGRITFWLPDSSIPIIIHPVSNPQSYQKVVDYIEKTTGYNMN